MQVDVVLPYEFWHAQQIAFDQNNIPFIKGDIIVTGLERTVAVLFFFIHAAKIGRDEIVYPASKSGTSHSQWKIAQLLLAANPLQ